MPQPYQLAQTFAPTADYEERLATLEINVLELHACLGISQSTYIRMRRRRTVSRKTAQRIARGAALVHGGIHPHRVFEMLFTANPRITMEPKPCGRYRRRND